MPRVKALLFLLSILTTCGASAETLPAQAPPAASVKVAVAPRIGLDALGALPIIAVPSLSPSGMRVAAVSYAKGRKLITIWQLQAQSSLMHSVEVPDGYELEWFRWAGDDQLIISVGYATRYFDEDVHATRLLKFDLRNGTTQFVGKRGEGIDGDDVIFIHPDGGWLLLSVQKSIYDYPSVYRVDLASSKMQQVVKQYGGVWDWFADSRGVVRAGLVQEERRWWLLYRKDETESFKKVLKGKVGGEVERFLLLNERETGYAVANGPTGRYGLYRYDFANDALGAPVFEHPAVDIDDFRLSESGDVEAVYYTDDRSRVAWLDPQKKALQAEIDGALPDRINRVVSMSRDARRMLVWTSSAADPGAYYLFNPEAGVMMLFARPYERLKGATLAPMTSTRYAARDGLEIPAYLTLPVGVEPRSLPLIVMPHGGPFARDAWTFDSWVQFLANRGYAVLQPNFRGSTGYGTEFVAKGYGQWGRGMQDDLDDGVKWLVQSGTVDPRRVCIMGASYGGYAAMWAAARNPDVYRCAISFAGVSDLASMMRYDRQLFAATRYYRDWRMRVQGEKGFDLDSVSPLRAVDRVRVPLLIAHGSKDDTVPPSQSIRMHEALTKAGKPHEFTIYEGAGHGLSDPAHAIDFLGRVEAFLQTHNPSRMP